MIVGDRHNREKFPGISGKTSLVRTLAFVDTALNIGNSGSFSVNRRKIAAMLPGLSFTLALGTAARADDSADPQLQEIRVTATAMPGTKIDIDKIPGNVQILSSADLTREGSASLTTALNSNLSSVNVNDDLADPFQPDILYRGFEASPALGTPQGLAVYQNGADQ